MFSLGMVSTNWYMLLLCGGDTKFKVPKAGNGDVFFPNIEREGEICKSRRSCGSTIQLSVKHRHQRICSFYPRSHCR